MDTVSIRPVLLALSPTISRIGRYRPLNAAVLLAAASGNGLKLRAMYDCSNASGLVRSWPNAPANRGSSVPKVGFEPDPNPHKQGEVAGMKDLAHAYGQ